MNAVYVFVAISYFVLNIRVNYSFGYTVNYPPIYAPCPYILVSCQPVIIPCSPYYLSAPKTEEMNADRKTIENSDIDKSSNISHPNSSKVKLNIYSFITCQYANQNLET